jgi:hypothetical protein
MVSRGLRTAALASVWLVACSRGPHGASPDAPGQQPDARQPQPDAATPPADPLAALAALPSVCSDDGWCWSNPTPSGTYYAGFGGPTPDNIWLTGGGPPSFAAIMQWNGQEWITHKPPVPAGSFEDYPPYLLPMALATSSPTNTWLVYNNVLEHYDGSTWTIVDVPYGPTAQMLDGVWIDPSGDPWVTSGDGDIRRYHDGQVAQLLHMGAYAGSIWGTDVDDVFITTIGGVIHYDGTSFTQISNLTVAGYMGVRGDVWISGDSAIVHWDGVAATDVAPAGVTQNNIIQTVDYQSSSDISWIADGSNDDAAPATYIHWDGAQFTLTPIATAYSPLGDNTCAALGAATRINGKIALVCDGGQLATLSLPETTARDASPSATLDMLVQPFIGGGTWAASMTDVYMSVGFDLRHWDGKTWTSLGVRASAITGIAGAGIGGADELFATNFVFSGSDDQYTTYFDHFDGSAWTSIPMTQFPLFGPNAFLTNIYPLDAGEAMIIGGGGTAFHYHNGSATPIATGTTQDLSGIWGPDADHLSITGANGTLLQWVRTNPGAFTPDPTAPATTDYLSTIVHAGTTTWMVAGGSELYVYRKPDGGTWQTVPTPGVPQSIAALSDDDVVVDHTDSGILSRWNGAAFERELYPSWRGLQQLSTLPDGTILVTGNDGMIFHAPPAAPTARSAR